MANQEHYNILKDSVINWNQWREENPETIPDLKEADLSNADLREANLSNADLSGAILRVADLNKANLSNANLSGAKLRKAKLREANLTKTNLSKANLDLADLRETTLTQAKLTGASLTETRFRDTDFTNADLSNSNFKRVDLRETYLDDAIWRNAVISESEVDIDQRTQAIQGYARFSDNQPQQDRAINKGAIFSRNKAESNNNKSLLAQDLRREELDIPIYVALSGGLILTIFMYSLATQDAALFGAYMQGLLSKTASTRNVILTLIFLAMTVITFIGYKLWKLQKEFGKFRQDIIPSDLYLKDPTTPELYALSEKLSKANSLIAIRCRRVLEAYIDYKTKNVATEVALDDSSFYMSASNASYSFPRILIWAIPLIGFIGTVWGIGQAIGGFSQFLGNSSAEEGVDTQQLQEAIGNVTTNLATAFETTLVALFLSVLVMIILVIVQRLESRLLLRIDVYVNQKLLLKLGDFQPKDNEVQLDKNAIYEAVKESLPENLPNQVALSATLIETLDEKLPSAEDLVKPAQNYAQEAAKKIAQVFIHEISGIKETVEKPIEVLEQLLQRQEQLTHKTEENTQNFLSQLKQQQENYQDSLSDLVKEIHSTNTNLVAEIHGGNNQVTQKLQKQAELLTQQLEQYSQTFLKNLKQEQHNYETSIVNLIKEIKNINLELIAEMQGGNNQVSEGFQKQAQLLTQQLEKAASGLESRVATLEPYAAQIANITQLQQVLKQNLDSLATTGHLSQVMTDLSSNLAQLQPVLQKLHRPRKIEIIDRSEDESA